ncbi:MAG: glycosyltransferase [Flaviflexus sp.]|nr:glycosyltransferase [Flaviflexus sp.]
MKLLVFAAVIALGLFLSVTARYREGYRRPLIALYCVIAAGYLIWRVGWTLPTEGTVNRVGGIAFLLLEIITIIQTVGFGLLFWKPAPNRRGPALFPGRYPTVDVFIATYNEPSDILEPTIVAATQLDYPADRFKVWVCDDGDRPEIAQLAKKWNVGYLRRDDHKGAKAGNLNNALTHTNGEFVVTMDADMVLKPQFLAHMVGHFASSDVAFVQAPQAFHNADVFQHNLFAEHAVRNDQDFFMRHIEPQRDMHNAAIYIGSGAIFRRSALDSIGGFVTDVITEDMATGLVLQNAGWRAVYVNEVLATGLAAETYDELLKQRIRWGRGNVQVAKKYGAHRLRNLSLAQKWLLYDSVHFWFFGIYRLAFLLLPIIVLFTGVQILSVKLTDFLLIWGAQFAYSRFVYDAITKGRFKTVWTAVYELAQAPQISAAVLQELLFGTSIGFQVTTKGASQDRATFSLKAWPQLLLFIASLAALAHCGIQIAAHGWDFALPHAVPMAWLAYNTMCLIGALAAAIDHPRHRHRLSIYQAPGRAHISHAPWPVQIEALHTQKICFSVPAERLAEVAPAGWLELEGFDPLDIELEYAEEVGGTGYVFALLTDVSPRNYARLISLLNHLNTQRFQTRPSARRVGMYDATVGMMWRALVRPDRIMGGGKRHQLELTAQAARPTVEA